MDKEAYTNPSHLGLLSSDEQAEYFRFRDLLASMRLKTSAKNNQRAFENVLSLMRDFIFHGQSHEDLNRAMVCGITWLSNGIAINSRQFRHLIGKSKSSINNAFQSLGYGTIPTGNDSARELIAKFSFLKNNFAELRQWTVRQKTDATPSLEMLSEMFRNSSALESL